MRNTEVSEFIDLAYIWQERAIKAEAKLDRLIEGCMRCAGEDDHERFQRLRAEIDRLRLMVTSITGGLDEAIEAVHYLEAEVERLRMALDKIANPLKYIQMEARAKGAELNGVYAIMLSKDPSYLQEIAIAELDKEGER